MSRLYASENPVIEGLRGLAAMLVVATHYAHLITDQAGAWGFASTGVDLFFVLSGFVFAPYMLGKPLYYPAHLVRRLLRLYPLYLCALMLYVALKPADRAWDHFLSHIGMAHTLQSLEIASFYNPAFWSLPPEIEFYLALPLLMIAARYLGVWGVVVAAAMAKLLLVALADPAAPALTYRAIAMVHLPGLLVEFMLGCYAYCLSQKVTVWQRWCLLLLGVLALAGDGFLFTHFVSGGQAQAGGVQFWVSANMGLLAALAYMPVVAGLAGMTVTCQAWLVACLWAGRLSFGVYLFHNAMGQMVALLAPQWGGWTAWIVQLLCTLLLSAMLHLAVEAPARRLGRQLAARLQQRAESKLGLH